MRHPIIGLISFTFLLTAQEPAMARWRATLTISDESDPRAAELGKVFGLAVDDDGNIYAADIDNALIAVFGRDGRFRGQVGRKGRGPGEFQSPTGLMIDNAGRLWVRDLEVISRFSRDPRTGLIARYDTAFRQPMYFDWYNARASRWSTSGEYLHTTPSAVVGAQSRVYRYTVSGQLRDSLMVPRWPNESKDYARVALSASSGRMLRGLGRVPFAAVPAWDVTPRSTIVSTDGEQWRVRETDARGALVREIKRDVPPERIVPVERAESLAALTRRLDTLSVPLNKIEGMPDDVRNKRLPESYPAIQSLFAEGDGTVWVRRWSGAGGRGRTLFDVLDAQGRLVRRLSLPAVILDAPTPVLRDRFVVAAVEDRETGGVRLMRFEP